MKKRIITLTLLLECLGWYLAPHLAISMSGISQVASPANCCITNDSGCTTSAINTTGATLFVATQGSTRSGFGSLTDSQSNNWQNALTAGASYNYAGMWYAYAPTTSTSQTFSISGPNQICVDVTAWSGTLTTSSVFDSTVTVLGGQSFVSGPYQPGSITPSGAGELVVSVFGGDTASGCVSGDSGFAINSGFNLLSVGCDANGFLVDAAAVTAGTVNPTWSWSASYQFTAYGSNAAFKPALTPGSSGRPRVWIITRLLQTIGRSSEYGPFGVLFGR